MGRGGLLAFVQMKNDDIYVTFLLGSYSMVIYDAFMYVQYTK
jgi:hypothetical protein